MPEVPGVPGRPGPPGRASSARGGSRGWWSRPLPAGAWLPPFVTLVCIGAVIGVTLWQLHPSLLFSGTTSTGGDNGGHYALPAYLSSGLLSHGRLTGWDPSWYDGFPVYTYYFLLPDLLTALASKLHLMSYAFAFKMSTILGSLLLPVAAWLMARLFGMRRAYGGALAAITLCYLFDYTYTIDGGNLFSTLAGEYSFSLGLALGLVFLGLVAHGLRTGRFRGLTAVVFTLCLMAHLIPALFALAGAALLVGIEMLPAWMRPRDAWNAHSGDLVIESQLTWRQSLWWGSSTIGLSVLLSAFWWVPFGLERAYTNPMGYMNVTTYVGILFPSADLWALVLAGIAVIVAFVVRSRFGILFSVLGGLSSLVVIFDPQGALYNTRILPLWFICVFLMTGWLIATIVTTACDLIEAGLERSRARVAAVSYSALPPRSTARGSRWPVAAVAGPLVTLFVALAVVVTPFVSWLSGIDSHLGITPGANQIKNWSQTNYEGYEGQYAYPEYQALVETMEHVGTKYGCGRAMWEYEPNLSRFGSTMALMLLPYWSNGCIGSMEGLLFESSTTTPYHFINQSELSTMPSDPQANLDYSVGPNIPLGVQHLQLLGVRYYMASDPGLQLQASADPSLRLIATTGPWTSGPVGGATTTTTWKIYQVLNSPLVTPLHFVPAVEQGIRPGQSSWLRPAEQWYDHPSRWGVELAQSGPSQWPRVPIGDANPPRRRVASTRVSQVSISDDQVHFHVSRVGVPVLVKVSYFPNWHVAGASGPYRVTPNLMVVVPTAHDVTLTYGMSPADWTGDLLTLAGLVLLAVSGVVALRRPRPSRPPRQRVHLPPAVGTVMEVLGGIPNT